MTDSGSSSPSDPSSGNDPCVPPSEAAADAVVLDAKGLRALAHPVRVQLVGLLRKNGPSTATRLAERLGVNSGTASYHLRQLAAAGFVEEDTERGNARERWWRSVHQSTWFNDPELAVREPEAAMAYLQSVAATYAQRARRALNELQTMPRTWQEIFDMSDWPLRLTPAEAAALHEELRAVVSRYRRDAPHGQESARAPEGAERVSVILHLLPELDGPATPAGTPGPERPTGAETP
ncbi:ArsR/SmtB family transcription factor [Streptomyces sp. NPDC059649]|uniref:ArsR/SmtB family transcription factor n=1 Tax=Streptomyces sp. NPDC059649 TaxID=3346895 RepID=UPI0036B6133A